MMENKTAEENKSLSGDELAALKSVGVIAQNWYAVTYHANQTPYAIFQNEEYAKAYRDQFSATSIIEAWPMVIRDYRKGRDHASQQCLDMQAEIDRLKSENERLNQSLNLLRMGLDEALNDEQ